MLDIEYFRPASIHLIETFSYTEWATRIRAFRNRKLTTSHCPRKLNITNINITVGQKIRYKKSINTNQYGQKRIINFSRILRPKTLKQLKMRSCNKIIIIKSYTNDNTPF
ncbi:hypothetical protein D7M10_19410 [Pseudomonas fluorescens]|nr:hypothetical protein D7M10_19410 [Pseudomonas fluorescens]